MDNTNFGLSGRYDTAMKFITLTALLHIKYKRHGENFKLNIITDQFIGIMSQANIGKNIKTAGINMATNDTAMCLVF